MDKYFNFSIQNHLKFWLLEIEENPIKNLKIQWSRVEIGKKIKVRSQIAFLTGNSQEFEEEYKIKVTDKTLVLISNI